MEPAINPDLTHNVKAPFDLTFELLRDVGWTFPDADGDTFPDDEDCNANSDVRPTIVLGGLETLRAEPRPRRRLHDDRRDRRGQGRRATNQAASSPRSPALTNAWKAAGLITGRAEGDDPGAPPASGADLSALRLRSLPDDSGVVLHLNSRLRSPFPTTPELVRLTHSHMGMYNRSACPGPRRAPIRSTPSPSRAGGTSSSCSPAKSDRSRRSPPRSSSTSRRRRSTCRCCSTSASSTPGATAATRLPHQPLPASHHPRLERLFARHWRAQLQRIKAHAEEDR